MNASKGLEMTREDGVVRGKLDALLRALLVLSCVLLAAWRLECVRVGPDPDTDAYGHYAIARQLLETPFNFRIHWVWLPLYHCLLALGVAAGATLDHVRSSNALLTTLLPLWTFWELGRNQRGGAGLLDRSVPYLAALLVAAAPLAMQLGTTGQMEVFFASLLLVAASLARRELYGWLALVLSVAALTRYEAWAVVAAVGGVLGARRLRSGAPLPPGALVAVLAPALAVLSWASLRWLGGEPWFGFIGDNQAFAERVLDRYSAPDWPWIALSRYVLIVPWHVLGVGAVFAALGLWRALRKEGIFWVALPVAVLSFLTLSSLTRSQLGLDRHFFSVLPFVASWAAHGVVQVACWLGEAYARFGAPAPDRMSKSSTRPRPLRWTRLGPSGLATASFALLSSWVVVSALLRLSSSMQQWREVTRTALADARAAAEFLRTTPARSSIVCDEASVEVLSGLDADRFVRARVNEHVLASVLELAPARDIFVVSRAARLTTLARSSSVAFGNMNAAGDTLVVLHVPARIEPASSGQGVMPEKLN